MNQVYKSEAKQEITWKLTTYGEEPEADGIYRVMTNEGDILDLNFIKNPMSPDGIFMREIFPEYISQDVPVFGSYVEEGRQEDMTEGDWIALLQQRLFNCHKGLWYKKDYYDRYEYGAGYSQRISYVFFEVPKYFLTMPIDQLRPPLSDETNSNTSQWDNVDAVSIKRAIREAAEKLDVNLKRDGTVTTYEVIDAIADALGISIKDAFRFGFGD